MTYSKAFHACAVIGVVIAGAALASPAFGKSRPIVVQAPPDVITRHVSYADLNLVASAGQRTLVGRVRTAVNDLCDDITGGRDGSWTSDQALATCTRASWGQARPQISLAVQRARDIAMTGESSIAAAALTISVGTSR